MSKFVNVLNQTEKYDSISYIAKAKLKKRSISDEKKW